MSESKNKYLEIQERERDAYDFDWQKEKTKKEVVEWINKNLRPLSVLDLGAGKIKYPFEHVYRVDGNPEAEPDELADLGKPYKTQPADLVFSIEVAEHIPENESDVFVDNLVNNSKKWIMMTTCPPHDNHSPYEEKAHLNEQPINYWINKIKERGFQYQEKLSHDCMNHFKGTPHAMPWFRNNLAIFKCVESK